MQRKPSHFGSYNQPSPTGISVAAFASIGGSGGSRGSDIVGISSACQEWRRPCEAAAGLQLAWALMTNPMDAKLEDLRQRRDQAYHAGSPRAVERQHEKGKMLARERIDYFLDPGRFPQLALLPRPLPP